MATPERRAAEICERRDDSLEWMDRNFYPEWEEVTRAYRCEMEKPKDLDGEDDPTQTAVGMPDTFGYVRRAVARGTAQVPNLGFKSQAGIGDLIGRTLMSQWDRGGTHRWQKLHFLQTVLFGWSVRAWYWANETYTRRRRIDPFQEDSWGEIAATYKIDLNSLQPDERAARISELLARHGRGSMYLPVVYEYTAYEGPKSDVLSVADCCPQPGFRDIQSSEYFIVERRRNLAWIKATQEYYRDRKPSVSNALEQLLKAYPQGTLASYSGDYGGNGGRGTNFRNYLERAYDKKNLLDFDNGSIQSNTGMWTFLEEHRPGDRPTISWVAERNMFIGEVDYPYELEGKIAFTEATLIDDVASGIGDSVPRILRGLQQLHNRLANARADLADALVRPLYATTDRRLVEDGGKSMKRGKGMRLLYLLGGPNSLWAQNEGPAQSAAINALGEESAYMRMWQTGTGESNMSMAANVDPQQNRTATGARLSAAVGDILTADLLAMFGHSIRADAWMMYLLNRAEMTSDQVIDVAPYQRQPLDPSTFATEDPYRAEWVKVSPLDFQQDGEIIFEEGSTLAADDERNVTKAVTMIQTLGNRMDVNQQKLLADFLIAMGKGREIQAYMAPPPPQPPAEPPLKGNISFSGKDMAMLPLPLQQLLLNATGIDTSSMAQGPPQGPMPGGPPPGMQPGMPPQGQPPMGPPPGMPPQVLEALLAQMQKQGPPPSLGDAATGVDPRY